MPSLKQIVYLFSCLVLAVGLVGCGESSNPNADVPPEKMAPAPENLGDNPEYAEQMKSQ